MKILLTGATGQLGKSVQSKVQPRNHSIVTCNRSELDISNFAQVQRLFESERPDYVLNAAAYTNVPAAQKEFNAALSANAYGPLNLALAAENNGAKLIHISTNFVFGGEDLSYADVHAPTSPLNFYGVSKLAGEMAVIAQNSQNNFIVRTSSLYSEYAENFLTKILRKLKDNTSEIKVVSDQYSQPTYAGDLAEQIINLIESESAPGIYHFVNNGNPSWFEFAKAIARISGHNEERILPISFRDFDDGVNRPAAALLRPTLLTNSDPIDRTWISALDDCLKKVEA